METMTASKFEKNLVRKGKSLEDHKHTAIYTPHFNEAEEPLATYDKLQQAGEVEELSAFNLGVNAE